MIYPICEKLFFLSLDGGMCPDRCRSSTSVTACRQATHVYLACVASAAQSSHARSALTALHPPQMNFQLYSGGVLTASCGTNLDHGVLLVGYGVSEDGIKYWKVRN